MLLAWLDSIQIVSGSARNALPLASPANLFEYPGIQAEAYWPVSNAIELRHVLGISSTHGRDRHFATPIPRVERRGLHPLLYLEHGGQPLDPASYEGTTAKPWNGF